MARAFRIQGLLATGPSAMRLDGALLPGVVIPNNVIKTRRVFTGGLTKLTVRAKGSSVTGTPKLDIKALLSDAADEDGTGTQAATLNATQVTLLSTEVSSVFTSNGEQYVDVIVTCGASDTFTVTYLDVYAVPIYG